MKCTICGMRSLITAILVLSVAAGAAAQKTVSFPTEDGGLVYADVMGKASEASSWRMAAGSTRRAGGRRRGRWSRRGFMCWRWTSAATGNREVRRLRRVKCAALLRCTGGWAPLRKTGAKNVSVIGGSMGAGAAGDASIASRPGEIDRVVFPGGSPNGPAEKLQSASLFIVARDDASGDGPCLPGIKEQYEKAPKPKELIILNGSAHAQYLFGTEQGERVMREILRFLSAK